MRRRQPRQRALLCLVSGGRLEPAQLVVDGRTRPTADDESSYEDGGGQEPEPDPEGGPAQA